MTTERRPLNVIQEDIRRVSASLETNQVLTDRAEREQFLRDLQMELCLAWVPVFVKKINHMETRIHELEILEDAR